MERETAGAEKSEWNRSEWPLSSLDAAGCVSDGHFIWRNPVYETLDVRTHVCMRRLLFRRYDANGQETARSECSWNWIKSILYSRAAAPRRLASSWSRQCCTRKTYFFSVYVTPISPSWKVGDYPTGFRRCTRDRLKVVRLKLDISAS